MSAGRSSIALLDVRREEDFAAGHAPDAANISLEELATSSHELPSRTALIRVTDSDSSRAAAAQAILARRGNPIEIVSLASLSLSATSPASVRLWAPNPFLVEAFAATRQPIVSLSRYPGGGLGRGSASASLVESRNETALLSTFSEQPPGQPPPQPSPGVPGAGEMRQPIGAAAIGAPALDVACGTGRDAVWLALQGMQVDALDHLPDALDRATSLARRNRVSISAIQKDIEADPTLPAGYDLVCVFRYLHRPLWPALRNAVKPGGYIIYETFHTRTREAGGRPSSPDHLLQTGELAAAFDGFEILISRDCVERDGRYFSSLLARRIAT